MIEHVVGDARTFFWLLWMATFNYLALIPLGLISVWSGVRAKKDRHVLVVQLIPLCWLTPLILAAAFTDWTSTEAKTAGWVGWVVLLALICQAILSAFAVATLKGSRGIAIVAVLVNAVVGLFAAAVAGMDSSGDWL